MQVHITHDFELPACKSGHAARHIHDRRCLRAGGGHFVECACSQTRRHLEFEQARREWERTFATRRRRKASAPAADTVVQFPLLSEVRR